jgi:hypothetical protein
MSFVKLYATTDAFNTMNIVEIVASRAMSFYAMDVKPVII